MEVKQAKAGPGFFQWNTGGWFGAQLGSTVWMLFASAWMALLSIESAAIGLLCFAAPNILGIWLWRRRDQIAPHPAIQLLALSISGSGLLLLLNFEWFWPESVPRVSFRKAYDGLLAVPVFMALCFIVERRMVKQWSTRRGVRT